MKNKYQSEALQAIHEDMKGMHDLGLINDAKMREYNEMCLVKEPEPTYKTESPNVDYAASAAPGN